MTPIFRKIIGSCSKTFGMAAGQVDASDNKGSILALDIKPVTATHEGFWNWI